MNGLRRDSIPVTETVPTPLGVSHARLLAAIHRAAATADPAWSTDGYASLLATPGCFGFLCGDAAAPAGFVLLRLAADEAEVLMIAVVPPRQRRGHARFLLDAAIAAARQAGATRLLLEVARDNDRARGLYAAAGFREIATRRGYYRRRGSPVDALVLERDLRLGPDQA